MWPSRHLRFTSVTFAWMVAAQSPSSASPVLDDVERKSSRAASYRETVDRGTAAFVDRRFADAREAFEAAFALHPDPVLVFNIASCWRRDGEIENALAEYRRFLTLAPDDDARRMLAEETIAALEAEPPPTPAPSVELADPPRPTRSIWRPIGLGTIGIGAVGVIVGAVELVRAHSFAAEPSITQADTDGGRNGSRDGRDGRWDRDNDASRDSQDDNSDASAGTKRRAILVGASGAVVMIAGVTMYFIGRHRERGLHITASASSSGGQLGLGGRF